MAAAQQFRGASAESVAALTSELEALLSGASGSAEKAATLGDSLFAVSQTVRTEGTLRRFLTDQSVDVAAKQGLVTQVLAGKIDADAQQLVGSAVGRRWTQGRDLADALEYLSEVSVVRSAGFESGRLSDELFAFARSVQEHPELRDALSDPARSTADKARLIDTLLSGKALPATVTLAKQSLAGTYRTVSAALEQYQKIASAVHGEGVATVRAAAPLSDSDVRRLADALQRQYGRPVHINVLVDPAVLGGLKVEIGDDVIDGTVSSRLDDARRALAG